MGLGDGERRTSHDPAGHHPGLHQLAGPQAKTRDWVTATGSSHRVGLPFGLTVSSDDPDDSDAESEVLRRDTGHDIPEVAGLGDGDAFPGIQPSPGGQMGQEREHHEG